MYRVWGNRKAVAGGETLEKLLPPAAEVVRLVSPAPTSAARLERCGGTTTQSGAGPASGGARRSRRPTRSRGPRAPASASLRSWRRAPPPRSSRGGAERACVRHFTSLRRSALLLLLLREAVRDGISPPRAGRRDPATDEGFPTIPEPIQSGECCRVAGAEQGGTSGPCHFVPCEVLQQVTVRGPFCYAVHLEP